MDAFKQRIKEFLNTLELIFKYILNDICTKPRTFKIGVISIFLVVSFLVFLQSLLQLTPLLFLKLAQDQNGQADLVLTPVGTQNDSRNTYSTVIHLINFTEFQKTLKSLPIVSAMAPRWILPINISSPHNSYLNFKATGLILDSKREREQGIGINLQAEDLGFGECWISKTLASLLQIEGSFNVSH